MRSLTRRRFAELSAGSLAAVGTCSKAFAAAQCVAPPRQPYFPNLLLIGCATRQNFKLFRRYSDYIGLAGVVSMTRTTGAHATFQPGTLILFPWLKPKGQAMRNMSWLAALPASLSTSTPAGVIPGATLPQDEYLCRLLLKAPWTDFIGFSVDVPLSADQTRLGWGSNIAKLADGAPVGIDWTSANLNPPWFGGSNTIPSSDVCNGAAWRALIADALNQASTGSC